MVRVATLPLLGLALLLVLQLQGIEAGGPLPPCSQVAGGISGWDCYDPPTHPLPPCDYLHQRIRFDCSGWPSASHVAEPAPPAKASFKSSEAHDVKLQPSFGNAYVLEELPPCNQVWGGIPGWDCWPPADASH